MLWLRLEFALFAGVLASQMPAQAADTATIRAADRGAPYLFLRDGRKVVTNYTGNFPTGQARPLALASADFDEDGMPDLVSGYAAPDGTGIVTIHRGNVDALWPYGGAIRRGEPPAFLPDARVFWLPTPPDFLGAGDFDADGHWDIVAATLGSKTLYLLRGDGHGGFSAPERIGLPGAVTAFTTGEMNRADGLTDIAVGVSGPGGTQVLVFESPRGALRDKPEEFPMPAAVSALAMLPLDDSHLSGLAAGAGNQLLAIHGRDRKLSYPKGVRDGVAAAEITRQTLPFAVRALAFGRFTSATLLDLAALGDDGRVHFLERPDADYQAARAELPVAMSSHNGLPAPMRRGTRDFSSLPKKPESKELALRDDVAMPSMLDAAARLVTAHTSTTGVDDVIVVDTAGSRLHVISRNPAARSMRLGASLEAVGAPAAVLPMRMNPSALHGLVVLQQGQLEPSVAPQTAQNTYTVTNTQDPGPSEFNTQNTSVPGSLRWAISMATNAAGPSTINFAIPVSDPNYNPNDGSFTITPLPTTNCGGTGPDTVPCQGLPPLPSGCVLDGYTQPGGTLNGITQPAASPNTLIDGDNAVVKIRISGASANTGPSAVWLFNGNSTVRGIVATGFAAATINSGQNTSGGYGVDAESGGNVVEGNFLGTNAAGTAVIPNYIGTGGFGGGNVIGGTTPQARNLISGNSFGNFGSAVDSAPNTYFVQGNYVGTDRTGTLALGGAGFSNNGVAMVVGGTAAGAGNLMSGNSNVGIGFSYVTGNPFTPDSNIVQGNFVGTDVTGKLAVGNGGGIVVDNGQHNQVGGTTPAARNVVSGNFGAGIEIDDGALQNNVQGNYIGADVTGSHALANNGDGIYHATTGTLPSAVGTLIGGDAPGAGNVISGNGAYGIEFGLAIQELGVIGESVFGNLIGTDATGLHPMGNGLAGIIIRQGGGFNTIGGTDAGAGNAIAYNGGQGILINPAANNPNPNLAVGPNPVIGNSIFSNTGEGVAVLSGADNQISQNAIYSNGGLGIDIGAAGANGCQTNTNGANNLQNAPVLTAGSGGVTLVTATATDPNGNTSQFSNCAAMSNSGNALNITGQLNSLPNTAYSIEFFQNATCGTFVQGQTFLNRISVTTGANCIANFNDSVNIATADLSLALTGPEEFGLAQYGSNFTYQAVVTNNGGASASQVSLSDTLPASETIVSVSPTVGTCGAVGNAVTCSLGTMPSGSTATVNMVVTVNAVGSIGDTASVTSTTPDPNTTNNTSTLNITSNYGIVYLDHSNPSAGVAGSGGIGAPLPLIVAGSYFYPGVTTVTVNGTAVSSTVTNDQTCGGQPCQGLHITIPAALTAAPGTLTIGVTNPAPGGGNSSLSFTIYPNPGTVTQFQLTGVPNPAVASTSYNLTVTALDNCGNVVPAYRGIISLTDSLGVGSFTPASGYQFTATDNGVHTFSTSFLFPPGFADIVAATDAGTPSITGTLTVTVGPLLGAASQLTAGATPGKIPIGFAFQPLIATVEDASGNPLPGVTVTFSVPATGASGTFSNGQATIGVVSDVNGNAQAVLTANQTAGTFQVNATAGALSAQWQLTSITNVPAHIAAATPAGLGCVSSVSGPIDTQNLSTLCLQVTDAQNNPVVDGIPVTFSAPATGASMNLSRTTVNTGNEGPGFPGVAVLAPIGVANAATGQYQVKASIGSLGVQFTFTNTATPPAVTQIFNTGGGQSATVRTQFATALLAMPQDANGECLAQAPVTFTAPTSGPSATLSAQTVLTDPVTCSAQVTATSNGIVGGPYNVTAAVGGVTATFALTNTIGMTTLTAAGGTPQATLPGTAFPAPLKVTLLDLNGSPLACRINFIPPASGASASLSAASVVANSSGAAQVTATADNTAGSYQVTALFGSARATFSLSNVTPGAVAAAGGTPQSTAPGLPFSSALQARVTDAGGNPIAGITVNFTAPATGAGATLSAASAVTNSAGVASVTATANSTLGGYSVIASVGVFSATFSLTNSSFSPCDVNQDGKTNVLDVQKIIDEALGGASPVSDLNGDKKVSVVDIQIVIDAVLNLGCSAG